MKSDLSLGDLKKQTKNLSKKSALKQKSIFFSELTYETGTKLFNTFSLLRAHNWFIFWHEI